jgi:hypothetical protein
LVVQKMTVCNEFTMELSKPMLVAARAEIAEPSVARVFETGEKRTRRYVPSARRLRALIEVLGFEGLGAQARFAKK